MSTTTIQTWGNSLAVRIPKSVLKKIHLKQGDEVKLQLKDGFLVLVPTKAKTLESLVSQITDENRHSETEWGKKGKEEW